MLERQTYGYKIIDVVEERQKDNKKYISNRQRRSYKREKEENRRQTVRKQPRTQNNTL